MNHYFVTSVTSYNRLYEREVGINELTIKAHRTAPRKLKDIIIWNGGNENRLEELVA